VYFEGYNFFYGVIRLLVENNALFTLVKPAQKATPYFEYDQRDRQDTFEESNPDVSQDSEVSLARREPGSAKART